MTNKFESIKLAADILESLCDHLDQKIESKTTSWEVIGKSTEQATSWRTGELLWEDEEQTIPKMKAEYGNVTHTFEELDESDQKYIRMVQKIKKVIENMDIEKLIK